MLMLRQRTARLGATLALAIAVSAAARAQPLLGDLDGDGAIGVPDEDLLRSAYSSLAGGPGYDPATDLDGDGRIGLEDLALLGTAFGSAGGDPDTTPPDLLVTLNDIPDDMNDLLVVPPERFQITLLVDSAGGSVVDAASLSVISSQDMGALAAGSELATQFTVTPTRAAWEVPAGSDLARTSHYLDVSIRDAAGNTASAVYGFAVRDFAYGAPFANFQYVFLDFDQDRSLGPEIDFLEDLREYGLSSAADPLIEARMRDWLVAEIVARVHPYFGRLPGGGPGVDPVRIGFDAETPAQPHSRLCVGGASSLGGSFLGASTLDPGNLDETSDECDGSAMFGVFPQAMQILWGANAELHAAFDPLDPDAGGVPVGEDPLDPVVTDPAFSLLNASLAEILRFSVIANAVDAFAQVIATTVAHETGHLLGLVAHGPTPGGLYGGTAGARLDHNETAAGGTPRENLVMNPGGAFTFQEMSGRAGEPLPVFRPLAWAYLHDRIALNQQVTALLPAPSLTSVSPNPAAFPPGQQTLELTFFGDELVDTPILELIAAGDPTPNPVLSVQVLDPQTATGVINKFLVPSGLYDVHLINPDGQEFTLADGLVVQ